MKNSTVYAIAAIALLGIAAPASADQVCTTDLFGTGFNYCQETHGTGDQVTAYDGLEFPGIAVTPTEPTVDENGDASTTDKTFGGFAVPTAEAYGHDATAVGNGARVGRFVEAVDASCDIGEVNGAGDGCVENDAVFTEAVAAHTVPADDGTALGARAVVEHEHSTAVGADAATDRENQVVLGTADDEVTVRNLANPASVDESARSVVVHQADGTLASDGGQIYDTLENHGSRIGNLENGVTGNSAAIAKNSNRIGENAEGIAVAMSMPDAFLDASENFSIAAGFGGFEGEAAFGAIGSIRIDQTFSLYGGGGISTNGGTFGWKVGARAGW